MWNITLGTSSGVSQTQVNNSLAVVNDAAGYWGQYIDFGGATIEITVNFISLGATTLAQAGPFFFSSGGSVFQAGPILELQSGTDPNPGEYDIEIDINTDSIVTNEFFFGLLGDDNVPAGDFDLFTVILHEIGHGLGFLSFFDEPETVVFDQFLGGVAGNYFFTGPLATSIFGGNVPLDPSPSHLRSTFSDLMTASLGAGQRQFLSPLDVAILQDIGLPILGPTSGADTLYGYQIDDTISLLGGDDLYFGLSGADDVDAGAGNDTLNGGAGADTLDGGSGTDTADYTGADAAIFVRLWSGTGHAGDANGDQLISIENATGTDFDDSLTGSATANTLIGGFGKDAIYAGGGDDLLIGGIGADTINGGAGFDTADFSGATSPVFVRLWAGEGFAGEALGDRYTDIEQVIGSDFDDSLTGSASSNTLIGGNGNDAIYAGNGDDLLIGGLGTDTVNGGGGFDILDYSSASSGVAFRLWAGLGDAGEALGDRITDIELVGGSAFNDTMTGSASADSFFGNGGDDVIFAGGGNDNISGGTGDDTMSGASGADIFHFDPGDGNDVIKDFTAGVGVDDVIELHNFGASLDEFAEVLAAATQVGSDVVIDLGGGNSVTLENVLLANLDTDDFAFI